VVSNLLSKFEHFSHALVAVRSENCKTQRALKCCVGGLLPHWTGLFQQKEKYEEKMEINETRREKSAIIPLLSNFLLISAGDNATFGTVGRRGAIVCLVCAAYSKYSMSSS